jgi:hypothetical protein
MSARKPSATTLPLRPSEHRPAQVTLVRRQPAVEARKGRRGRRSHDDYVKAVGAVLRADLFELEACALLGQLPGVRALAGRLRRGIFPTGLAIRTLLDRAVGEVELLALNQRDPVSQRIAAFLHLWYKERETVVIAAAALNLSRSYVAYTIQPRALELVAKRFLELAWRVEASA